MTREEAKAARDIMAAVPGSRNFNVEEKILWPSGPGTHSDVPTVSYWASFFIGKTCFGKIGPHPNMAARDAVLEAQRANVCVSCGQPKKEEVPA